MMSTDGSNAGTPSSIDVDYQRSITPGCSMVRHFNHAGASLVTQTVLDTQIEHLVREAHMGGYEARRSVASETEAVYESAARLVGSERREIGIVENATVGWQQAFYAFTRNARPGQRILASSADYGANIVALLHRARELELTIEVIPGSPTGEVDVEALRSMLGDDVALVSISHVPTNGGLVNPAVEIGAACADAGVIYLLDACQSAGQIPLDVTELKCDALTTTSRKYLRGPRGVGFLYMSGRWLDAGIDPVVLDHHSAQLSSDSRYQLSATAQRFENWEFNWASVLGLGAAIDHAEGLGLMNIWDRVSATAGRLRHGLAAIDRVQVRDIGAEKCGICTFTVEGLNSVDVQIELERHRINVSVSHGDGAMFDTTARGLPPMVRASVHYLTTIAEIDALCAVVGELTEGS